MMEEVEVSVRRASELTGWADKTLRRWIASGKLPYTRIAVNHYLVRLADIPPKSRDETFAALRDEISELKRRLEALESKDTRYTAFRADSGVAQEHSVPRVPQAPARRADASDTRPLSAGFSRRSADGETKAEVCRWLADGHGVRVNTARYWASNNGMPTERRAAFAWALEHERAVGWRKGGVHIHHCARMHCPCQDVPTA